MGKTESYSVEEIMKAECFRCGKSPCYAQWNICSDGNVNRPICFNCDMELNEMVLRFMRFSEYNIDEMINKYIVSSLTKYYQMFDSFPKGWECFVEDFGVEKLIKGE